MEDVMKITEDDEANKLESYNFQENRINYTDFRNIGLFFLYFCIGVCDVFTFKLTYEFFRLYLGLDGELNNISEVIISFPWTFKIFYGIINDCFPIRGYRRKPYMIIGWIGCLLVGAFVCFKDMPPSRYTHVVYNNGSFCYSTKSKNPEFTDEKYASIAMQYMFLLFLYQFFLVMSVVAMDGLMVKYARGENLKERGKAQTYIYAIRTVGEIVGACIKAFTLNWYLYSGPWCFGLRVEDLFYIIVVVPICAIPMVIFMTTETCIANKKFNNVSVTISRAWGLLRSKAILQVMIFSFMATLFQSLLSPADIMIKDKWVHVTSFVNSACTIFTDILFTIGTLIFSKYLLNFNWRVTFASTAIFSITLNLLSTLVVTFDIVRNQYLYLSDEIVTSTLRGMNFICSLLLIVELSEPHLEGILYSLITTSNNIGSYFSLLLSNIIVIPFHVSKDTRYDRDSPQDRQTIGLQACVIAAIQLCFIFFLPLLPKGKVETQTLKKSMGSTSNLQGFIILATLVLVFVVSVFLSTTWYKISPILHNL